MAEETQEQTGERREESQVEEAPKPRRRRRSTKADEASPEATADASKDGTAGEAPAAPKPRRGRRPKKAEAEPGETVDTVQQAATAAGQQASPSPDAAAAEAAEKPRRRPGRPRKKREDDQATDVAQPGDATAAGHVRPAGEQTTLDVGAMTRVTQEATVATGELLPAPATTIAQADAAQADAGARQHEQVRHDAGDQREEGEREPRRRRRSKKDQGDFQQPGQRDRGQQGWNSNSGRNGRNNQKRRNRRQEQSVEPSLSRDDVAAMKVAELRSKAAELGVEYVGVRKKDLAEAVYLAAARQEGFRSVEGVLEIQNEGYGFIRTGNYMSGDDDAFVYQQLIRQYGLRPGDYVTGSVAPARNNNSKFPPLHRVQSVNGRPPEEMRNRPRFRDLTPIYPNQRLVMEHGRESITGRAIDLVAPIGKGQRGLIVSPPKAGKTTVLKRVCQSIAANNPEVHLFCLLVDERPEEVTDMERSIRGTVVASTFDMPADNHTAVAELVIEHAKRLVELGEDVVVVLDSITRLARAYNLAQPASGRILSGGVDSAALYPPKKFLGAARNIENGGSLTILASALVDTGSKMDEVIFEEFKGTGNMELKLDRDLADKRIFPAIDPVSSGTRNEDLLIDAELQPFVWGIRRVLANMNSTERAASALVKGLKATNDNEEFLIRSAKKAQQADYL
ncbi:MULTISPECIES: transcription termination factor Rho [Olsenella]|uniref:transcription termination factor Rho n=1 Tax=Olsenella TaxID=133925 RepID=UPI0003084690|nr:transcription termination factor Rho [Olsenella sp. oral taxon 809]